MKKRIPAVILMFALFIGSALAVNAYQKSITVKYGITVEFNGQELSMTDADGIPVDAFVYEGTTYVPIRAISETFGADVGYDASTNTAYVYDDFTEIIVAAYKLCHIMSYCESAMDIAETNIDLYGFSSFQPYDISEDIELINQVFERNQRMLSLLYEENVNYTLIAEELIPQYNLFVNAYKDSITAYQNFMNTNSNVYESTFDDRRGDVTIARIEYENMLDSFLESFNWRIFE